MIIIELGGISALSECFSLNLYISRFRSLEVVAKEVTRLVRSDPVPFHTIPGAAQLLARRDGLQQGAEPVATELYHLLYWRNISPASTLIFFCRPFSLHPITAQFASKAMQSFKPVSNGLNSYYSGPPILKLHISSTIHLLKSSIRCVLPCHKSLTLYVSFLLPAG